MFSTISADLLKVVESSYQGMGIICVMLAILGQEVKAYSEFPVIYQLPVWLLGHLSLPSGSFNCKAAMASSLTCPVDVIKYVDVSSFFSL